MRFAFWGLSALLLTLSTSAWALQAFDHVVASVNDRAITNHQLQLKTSQGLLMRLAEPADGPRRQEYAKEILTKLIEDAILLEYAKEKGVAVSDSQVEGELKRFMARQHMTQTSLEYWLEKQSSSLDEFKDSLKESILKEMILGQEIKAKIRPNAEELQALYEQEPPKELEVRARHILILVPENAPPASLEQGIRHALKIRKEIESGKIGFTEAAKQYSADPSAQSNGGDLGYFRAGMMVPEFSEVAFSLKPGRLSQLVRSPFGLHIIEVLDRREAKKQDFEEAKRRFEKVHFFRQYEKDYQALLDKLKAKTRIRHH